MIFKKEDKRMVLITNIITSIRDKNNEILGLEANNMHGD